MLTEQIEAAHKKAADIKLANRRSHSRRTSAISKEQTKIKMETNTFEPITE